MFLDPFYLVILAVGALLSLGAQAWVKSKVNKWSDVGTSRGLSGREIALAILRAEGITNVEVEETHGFLSDHYDPSKKVLRLSPDIYGGRSIAAAGIAAHEVGHAIQDKRGYWPMFIRQKMVPVANIGTNLGLILVLAGLFIGITGLAWAGVLLFGGFVAFTLITLPVEFNASSRAKEALVTNNIITRQEAEGVGEVLTAAAATYVAAAATAILQLLYWISLVAGRRN